MAIRKPKCCWCGGPAPLTGHLIPEARLCDRCVGDSPEPDIAPTRRKSR